MDTRSASCAGGSQTRIKGALAAFLLFGLVVASTATTGFLPWGYQFTERTGTTVATLNYVNPTNPATMMDLSSFGTNESAVAFTQGSLHGAIATNLGSVYTWGYQSWDGSGSSGTSGNPVHKLSLSVVVSDVLCGDSACFAIENSTGNVYGWGAGSLVSGNTPTLLNGGASGSLWAPQNALSKFWPGGAYHFAGLRKSDGKLVMWGNGTQYQLGSPQSAIITNPITSSELENVIGNAGYMSVSLGASHTLVLTYTGVLVSFGANDYGQCGRGGGTALAPGTLSLGSGTTVVSIAAGNYHSLAISNGKIYVWGRNNTAQLGPTTGAQVLFSQDPLEMAWLPPAGASNCLDGFPTQLQQVAIVANTNYLLLTSGDVYSWGDSEYKLTARGGETGGPARTAFVCNTFLKSILAPGSYIAMLYSTPIPLSSTTYAAFARVETPPAPAPAVVPALPLSPVNQPMTSPVAVPDSTCPLPAPQPISEFECRDGTWVAPGGISGPGTVIIGTPIIVIGDWNTTGTVTIINPGSLINVTGCLSLEGQIEITVDPSSAPRQSSIFVTNCISTISSSVSVKPTSKSCKKFTGQTSTTDGENGQKLVSIIFTTDDFKCKVWWIILVSVLGGLIVLVAIFLIVVFSVPSLRNFFRPFARRSEKLPEAGKLH